MVASTNTKTTTENIAENIDKLKTEVPALAKKVREQLVSTVQQSQQLSVDAAQTWVKAASALPTIDLAKVPGIPAVPDLQAATKYTFDVAADLLGAQREYALQLAGTFVPAKTS
jgi:hypothetical protein